MHAMVAYYKLNINYVRRLCTCNSWASDAPMCWWSHTLECVESYTGVCTYVQLRIGLEGEARTFEVQVGRAMCTMVQLSCIVHTYS